MTYQKTCKAVPSAVLCAAMLDTGELQRRAKKQGFTTPYQLAAALIEAGHNTSRSQVTRLWNGTSDPKLSTVDRLCEILDCEVADILKRRRKRRRPMNGSG